MLCLSIFDDWRGWFVDGFAYSSDYVKGASDA